MAAFILSCILRIVVAAVAVQSVDVGYELDGDDVDGQQQASTPLNGGRLTVAARLHGPSTATTIIGGSMLRYF